MTADATTSLPVGVERAVSARPRSAPTTAAPPAAVPLWRDQDFVAVHSLVLYYLALMAAGLWLVLDLWSGGFQVLRALGVSELALQQPLLRSTGYTLAGGLLGSVLYQMRMLFRFYLKTNEFDHRWLGKYLSAPLESAAMALVVLALLRGGLTAFAGSPSGAPTTANNFSALGLGALIGFGMRDVVGWLGRIVGTVFVTAPSASREAETRE